MKNSIIRLFGFACLTVALTLNLPAKAKLADNLILSKEDTTNLMRIQKHLNSSKTVKARFLQISSNGEYAEGQIFIQRPGRLRLIYDDPNSLLVSLSRIFLLARCSSCLWSCYLHYHR